MTELPPNQQVPERETTASSSPNLVGKKPSRRLTSIAIIILSVMVVGSIALGGWWFFQNMTSPESLPETTTNQNVTDTELPSVDTTNAAVVEVTDSDSDGLNDQEEAAFGTDPNQADTDGDGVNDKQEVIYYTNPTNADTDGDSYPDGAEIEQGYDPRGPGRLYITEF